MITEFGKFLRSLRQSHAELLKNMAETLDVSAAFLSAVEAGKKSIPPTLVQQIIEAYKLPAKQVSELRDAVDASQRSATIDLTDASPAARGVAVALARQFNSLSGDELAMLKKTMDEVRKRMKD